MHILYFFQREQPWPAEEVCSQLKWAVLPGHPTSALKCPPLSGDSSSLRTLKSPWLQHSASVLNWSGPGILLNGTFNFFSHLHSYFCSGDDSDGTAAMRDRARKVFWFKNPCGETFLCFLLPSSGIVSCFPYTLKVGQNWNTSRSISLLYVFRLSWSLV